METTIQTNIEDWVENLDTFTLDNTGRLITFKIIYPSGDEQVITKEMPFVGIEYYGIKKGDEIVLSIGADTEVLSHSIESPVELWETKSHAQTRSLKIITMKEEAYELVFID